MNKLNIHNKKAKSQKVSVIFLCSFKTQYPVKFTLPELSKPNLEPLEAKNDMRASFQWLYSYLYWLMIPQFIFIDTDRQVVSVKY